MSDRMVLLLQVPDTLFSVPTLSDSYHHIATLHLLPSNLINWRGLRSLALRAGPKGPTHSRFTTIATAENLLPEALFSQAIFWLPTPDFHRTVLSKFTAGYFWTSAWWTQMVRVRSKNSGGRKDVFLSETPDTSQVR